MKSCGEYSTCAAALHTLHHASIEINILDVSCTYCGEFLRFDGEWEGLISTGRNDVYTRTPEQLDLRSVRKRIVI